MKLRTSQDIGNLIHKVRKSLKVTQKDLAASSGTGIRFIQELERGKPTCELEKVLIVLSMLGIHLDGVVPLEPDRIGDIKADDKTSVKPKKRGPG